MKKSIEYNVRPLDKYGDPIDIEFFDSKKEMINLKQKIIDYYPQAVNWEISKHIMFHEFDGELVDEEYQIINW